MKKISSSLATIACFLLVALFVTAYYYAVTELSEKVDASLVTAYNQLPWK